jgi:hypothetical protein
MYWALIVLYVCLSVPATDLELVTSSTSCLRRQDSMFDRHKTDSEEHDFPLIGSYWCIAKQGYSRVATSVLSLWNKNPHSPVLLTEYRLTRIHSVSLHGCNVKMWPPLASEIRQALLSRKLHLVEHEENGEDFVVVSVVRTNGLNFHWRKNALGKTFRREGVSRKRTNSLG